MNVVNKALHSWLDWLFPPDETVGRLADMSLAEFLRLAQPAKEQVPGIVSRFAYKDELVQAAVWQLKYHGDIHVGRLLAHALYDTITEHLISHNLLLHDFLIIPLPISKERFKERGWNQSEILATEIAKLDNHLTVCTDCLIKTKHTVPQTTLNRAERLINLKNCFKIINPEKLKYKNIILLDDVTTTGSTINEAKQTLQHSGAKTILAFTLAH